MKLFVFLLLVAPTATAQTISDYFDIFPPKDIYFSRDRPGTQKVNIDIKNAFISVQYTDSTYGEEFIGELQFTYFAKQDKKKVFGFTNYFDGPSSRTFKNWFYEYENGKWREVNVLPKLTLDDFDATSNKTNRSYRLQYLLPQHGTEISVKVVEDGELDSGDWGDYIRYLESLPMRKLRWDRANGVFKLAKPE